MTKTRLNREAQIYSICVCSAKDNYDFLFKHTGSYDSFVATTEKG